MREKCQHECRKIFKVNNKDTRTTPCSSVSIVIFEQVNTGWVLDLT